MSDPCRILIADDARDLRELLCLLLEVEDDFEVVGQAADGAEAVRLTAERLPDLVVMDLSMPVMDGLAALPELRRVSPASKVVIFSGFEAQELAREVRRGGADAYIEKGAGVIDLVDQLRCLCNEAPRTA